MSNTAFPTPDESLDGEDKNDWSAHNIDIRLSIPFFGRGLYLTLVSGRERRPANRRATERGKYPLLTLGNLMFGLGLATMGVLSAIILFLAQSAIIEY